jgi:flagellar basal-body rod modification protein FlgD
MTVPPVTSGSATTDSTAIRVPQKMLGQNDFLKLLAAQFQTQDPMKPMEDTAFIAQMAQFSSLEQANTTTGLMTAMRTDQQRATANSYLGRQVTVDAGDGTHSTGMVSAVETTAGEPRLVIGDLTYPLSAVLLVEPGTSTAPTSSPASAGGA